MVERRFRPQFTILRLMAAVAIVALGCWIFVRLIATMHPIVKITLVAMAVTGLFYSVLFYGLTRFLLQRARIQRLARKKPDDVDPRR